MKQGTITKYNPMTGAGTITREGDGTEVVFNDSSADLEGFYSLQQGQRVEFDVARDDSQRATYVRALSV